MMGDEYRIRDACMIGDSILLELHSDRTDEVAWPPCISRQGISTTTRHIGFIERSLTNSSSSLE